MMRILPVLSTASWTLAWAAAFALAAPMAAAQNSNADGNAAAQARDAGPQAGFSEQDEEDRCKLITVERGEGAELVEEKTPEQGRDFAFLESQEGLLEDFRVDEERRKDCVLAFGLSFAGGPGAAPAAALAGAAPGAGLAGAPIAAGSIAGSVGIGVLSAATLAALAAAVAAGSGGEGPAPAIPPTTTE